MLVQAFAYERAGNRGLAEFWVNAEQGWCEEFPILQAIAMRLLAQRETR
jgi:hypothetical protein